MTDIQHLDYGMITDAKLTETPRYGHNGTGYGAKMPLGYMLKIGTRWHRVYCVNYSNSGSLYVVIGGVDHYTETLTEHLLELMRNEGKSYPEAKEATDALAARLKEMGL